MRSLLLLLVLTTSAGAEPAPLLPVKDVKDGTLESFRVVAPTPKVTAEVNRAIRDTLASVAVSSGWPRNPTTITCKPEIVTDRLVSWRCDYRTSDGMTGGVFSDALIIDGDTTRPASTAELFGPNVAKLAKLKASCNWQDAQALVIGYGGIEAIPQYTFSGCTIDWQVLEPLLPAKSPIKALFVQPTEPVEPIKPNWAKAPARFVTQKDGVLDRVTGLVWAAQDNGSDVTWEQAKAYARDYRGGGHADWRLPTGGELEVFGEPEMAHKEKADCTKGTVYLLSTPLVKLSCGMAWSSTAIDKQRASAFGFVSGALRTPLVTDRKNLRALVVRKP